MDTAQVGTVGLVIPYNAEIRSGTVWQTGKRRKKSEMATILSALIMASLATGPGKERFWKMGTNEPSQWGFQLCSATD